MRFPTIEEMAKTVAEKALNEYEYEGKTIMQWVEILKDYDDKKSTLQRIVERLEYEKETEVGFYQFYEERDNEIMKHATGGKIKAFKDAIEIVKEEGGIE